MAGCTVCGWIQVSIYDLYQRPLRMTKRSVAASSRS